MGKLIKGIQLVTIDWTTTPTFPNEFEFDLDDGDRCADKVLLIVDSDGLTVGAAGTIIKMRVRMCDDATDADADTEVVNFATLAGGAPINNEDIITGLNPAAFKVMRRIVQDNVTKPAAVDIVAGRLLRVRLELTSTAYVTGKTRFKLIANG